MIIKRIIVTWIIFPESIIIMLINIFTVKELGKSAVFNIPVNGITLSVDSCFTVVKYIVAEINNRKIRFMTHGPYSITDTGSGSLAFYFMDITIFYVKITLPIAFKNSCVIETTDLAVFD